MKSTKVYYQWRPSNSAKSFMNEKSFRSLEECETDAERWLKQTNSSVEAVEIFQLVAVIHKRPVETTREMVWENYEPEPEQPPERAPPV